MALRSVVKGKSIWYDGIRTGGCDGRLVPLIEEAADAVERLTRERDEALRAIAWANDNVYGRAPAAEAREAKLREAFLQQVIARIRYIGGRINMQEDDIEVLTDDLHVALATKGEPMPVYQNDGRVTTSATVPSATRRDPVAEAVERMMAARFRAALLYGEEYMEAVLAAALAPYGGLGAIKRLEELK